MFLVFKGSFFLAHMAHMCEKLENSYVKQQLKCVSKLGFVFGTQAGKNGTHDTHPVGRVARRCSGTVAHR